MWWESFNDLKIKKPQRYQLPGFFHDSLGFTCLIQAKRPKNVGNITIYQNVLPGKGPLPLKPVHKYRYPLQKSIFR